MTTLQSSQNFARALKAASDPPSSNSPAKVEIARQAWDDASFYVPNKAEFIVEWILTNMLKGKGKGKERSQNPISDARYWTLLSDILCSADTVLTVANARPLKSWLTPLLHRITIVPIITNFLNILRDLSMEEQVHLPSIVIPSFAILWPIGNQKMTTEQLLECWGLSLDLTTCFVNPDVVKMGQLITKSYRHSFANSLSKKKLYTAFLQFHLEHWLQCIAVSSPTEYYQALHHDTLEAGFDVIFSVDILRHEREDKVELSLFDALERLIASSKDTILAVLPQLFAGFVRAIRKYRGTLFSQGSNKTFGSVIDELHSVGMKFFMSCLTIASHGDDDQKWVSIMKLLSVVDQEKLFHQQQIDSGIAFTRIIEDIISVLKTAGKVEQLDTITAAMQCLTIIARIDCDIIIPTIGRILPHILLISEPNAEHFSFLEVLIDYYSKTRTMNIYIDNLFTILAPRHTNSASSDIRKTYESFFSGPLLHANHLKRLSKALREFLTLSQCIPTTSSSGSWWGRLVQKEEEEIGIELEQDPDIIAISFSLLSKLSTTILSSIPSLILPSESMKIFQEKIGNFRENVLDNFQNKYIKVAKETCGGDEWSAQIVSTAILRLRYALAVSSALRLPKHNDLNITTKLSEMLDNDTILPEFAIEIFRKLFQEFSLENAADARTTIDKALRFLENNFQATDVSWSGQSYTLTFGQEGKSRAALALLHMILERWLPVVEHIASSVQLERLVKIIMSIRLTPSETITADLSAPMFIRRALHCAEFWELHQLRAVFLSYLTETTAILDNYDSKKIQFTHHVTNLVEAYRLLLLFPPEYLTRTSRTDFGRRALSADRITSSIKVGKDYSLSFVSEALCILRTFIKRVFVHSGAVEQSNQQIAEFLDRVSAEEYALSEVEQYNQITLDLSELYLLELLKSSQTNQSDGFLKVLSSLSQHELFQSKPTIRTGIFTRLIKLLATKFSLSVFTEDIISLLKVLYDKVFRVLHPRMNALILSDASFTDIGDHSDLLSSWAHLLKFGSWLEMKDTPLFGQRIVVMLTSIPSFDHNLDSACISAFSIILKEIDYLKVNVERLDMMTASYIAFATALQTKRLKELDARLSRTSQRLLPEEFGYLLRLVSESLRANAAGSQLQHLVHLAKILLRNHPQNSLKHIQTFAMQCLGAFVNNPLFTAGPVLLRLEVLDFVAQHCSERPSALRTIDVGGIWTLFSQLLSPSDEHDDTTCADIFHKITTTISSLIRLRRDLLILNLPHLSMILRQLMLGTRSCRLQLGSKQLKLVLDTLPRWINPIKGLGAEEGRVLSRVLEALTTKTLVRSHTAPETQKAESLARPFSKHAAYVLKAYIEGMNDALCVLPLELRKELQPGLYALCDMINDHSRDAMMVSGLDSSGKVTMKALWKEYEKQRYVGKG
ncbi:Urb2/Npa2 family-domain-containing protein [Cyathus striatus]|nr:Urb2/Npa2 family-domain-containing protein [Cyathus striatus]